MEVKLPRHEPNRSLHLPHTLKTRGILPPLPIHLHMVVATEAKRKLWASIFFFCLRSNNCNTTYLRIITYSIKQKALLGPYCDGRLRNHSSIPGNAKILFPSTQRPQQLWVLSGLLPTGCGGGLSSRAHIPTSFTAVVNNARLIPPIHLHRMLYCITVITIRIIIWLQHSAVALTHHKLILLCRSLSEGLHIPWSGSWDMQISNNRK